MRIPKQQIYDTNYKLTYQIAKEKQETGTGFDFIDSGYFYNSEGDGWMYYRYVIDGVVCDLQEEEVHLFCKMTQEERKTEIIKVLFSIIQFYDKDTSDLSY